MKSRSNATVQKFACAKRPRLQQLQLRRERPSQRLQLSCVPMSAYTRRMRDIVVVVCLGSLLFAESVAGLKWTSPRGWKTEAPKPMRAATYSISPASGDTASAECAVYFFGAGQGGSVESNLERWKGQVLGSDGKPADAKITKRTVHGLAVTTIDSSGDYTGMGGPMSATKSVQSN